MGLMEPLVTPSVAKMNINISELLELITQQLNRKDMLSLKTLTVKLSFRIATRNIKSVYYIILPLNPSSITFSTLRHLLKG